MPRRPKHWRNWPGKKRPGAAVGQETVGLDLFSFGLCHVRIIFHIRICSFDGILNTIPTSSVSFTAAHFTTPGRAVWWKAEEQRKEELKKERAERSRLRPEPGLDSTIPFTNPVSPQLFPVFIHEKCPLCVWVYDTICWLVKPLTGSYPQVSCPILQKKTSQSNWAKEPNFAMIQLSYGAVIGPIFGGHHISARIIRSITRTHTHT